ncbi:MAG TPA: MauE/DoxX family redox-associated membrane protein [Puia sp.]|nr:MauE/DoxX family redox-associated membrane protein [Puia sp.]
MTRRQVLIESISGLLIMLFLYASISKFLDFKRFISEMSNQPFPTRFAPYLVWAIPGLEIAISFALVFERSRKAGFIASLVLMGLFTIYTGSILLHFFHYVPCSCGGVIRKLTWSQHLVFNLFFVGLAITGIILQHRKRYQTITLNKIKNSFV